MSWSHIEEWTVHKQISTPKQQFDYKQHAIIYDRKCTECKSTRHYYLTIMPNNNEKQLERYSSVMKFFVIILPQCDFILACYNNKNQPHEYNPAEDSDLNTVKVLQVLSLSR